MGMLTLLKQVVNKIEINRNRAVGFGFLFLLSFFGSFSADAQVTTIKAWTNEYSGTSTDAETSAYPVPAHR